MGGFSAPPKSPVLPQRLAVKDFAVLVPEYLGRDKKIRTPWDGVLYKLGHQVIGPNFLFWQARRLAKDGLGDAQTVFHPHKFRAGGQSADQTPGGAGVNETKHIVDVDGVGGVFVKQQ